MYSERKTEIDERKMKKKTSAWSVGGSIEQQVNSVCTGQWQRVGLVSQGLRVVRMSMSSHVFSRLPLVVRSAPLVIENSTSIGWQREQTCSFVFPACLSLFLDLFVFVCSFLISEFYVQFDRQWTVCAHSDIVIGL